MRRESIVTLIVSWIVLLAAVGVAALVSCKAEAADIVTELGAGIKMPGTSDVLLPVCERVTDSRWDYDQGKAVGSGLEFKCGGDNPAFIGWPIAVDFRCMPNKPWIKCRGGWFHYSNWFDGGGNTVLGHTGDRFETHMDLAAITMTFNWSELRRHKRRKPSHEK